MDIFIFIAMLLIVDNQTIYCGRPDNCIMEVWLAHPEEYCHPKEKESNSDIHFSMDFL